MKKQHLYLCLLASMLGMMTTGCSDETTQTDIPTAPDEDGRITVTASAGMPQGGASTRLGFDEKTDDNKLVITWEDANETFSVLGGTESATPSLFTQTAVDATDKHKANFRGQINADESTTYYAVYPEITGNTAVAATSIPLDMTGQTGTALDEKKTYMYATSKYDATNNALTFGFNHLTSILKVTLKFTLPVNANDAILNDVTKEDGLPTTRATTGKTADKVTFTADGLMSKASVDLTGNQLVYTSVSENTNSLTLGDSFALNNFGSNEYSTTVYLYVLPGTLKDLTVSAMVDGVKYSCTLSAQTTPEAGKMYTVSEAKMERPTFTVDTKIGTYSVNYNYNGLKMQIGTYSAENPAEQVSLGSATITDDGQATFFGDLSEYVGKTIWVCIPKVVKFFHKVTTEDVKNKTLELPNKDNGSTLLVDNNYKAGDKYYKNDWIVALYIGINKNGAGDSDTGDGATPIYWATGNLIAIKTNEANSSNTEAAFHIASKNEARDMENNDAKSLPAGIDFDGNEGTDDYNDPTKGLDGYKACAVGSRWDRFGWGDASGLMTALNYTKYAATGDYDPTKYSSSTVTWLSISGDTEYDIARKNLGGSWRLPAGGSSANSGRGELRNLIDDTEHFNKADGTYTYTYTEKEKGIQNTLRFPATGDRNGTEVKNTDAGCYWSGVAQIPEEGKTGDDAKWRARGFYLKDNGSLGDGKGGFTRKSGRAIRPVTE